MAGQTRLRLQAPGLVEQVLFLFLRLVQGVEALLDDDMAGRAGAAHITGMLDIDAVVQHGFTDRSADGSFDLCTVGAVLGVRKNFDDGHCSVYELNGVDTLASQRLLDAAIHAFGRKRLGSLGQGLRRAFHNGRIIAGDGRA
ncbi:hypothetical protein SDC9_104169 [bioreactor metagenome]|uniref:Uncharacterized protein n=1 Tax=bioreactor metagenome TaxID=1076179 RepID=A0A645AW20_9ZZZZ